MTIQEANEAIKAFAKKLANKLSSVSIQSCKPVAVTNPTAAGKLVSLVAKRREGLITIRQAGGLWR